VIFPKSYSSWLQNTALFGIALAGTKESPGETSFMKDEKFKSIQRMGSGVEAMKQGSTRYVIYQM